MVKNKLSRAIPLAEKLPLYFIITGLTSILIVGIFAYYSARTAMIDRTFNQLTSVRIEKQKRIQKLFEDAYSGAQMIDFNKCKQLINNLSITDYPKHIIEVAPEIDGETIFKYGNQDKIYSKCYIIKNDTIIEIDLNLNTIRNSKSITQAVINQMNSNIIESNKNNNYSQCLFETDNFIYAGIKNNNIEDYEFSLLLEINQKAIDEIMLENDPYNGLGKSGESYLVGKDFLLRSKSRFIENSVRLIKAETQGVINSFRDETGVLIFVDYRGIRVLSSYSRLVLEDIDWAILAEIDEKEAMIPVYNLRSKIMLSSIIISFILLIISYFITKRLIKPLKELSKKSIEVAKGNFVLVEESSKNDEIRDLTISFNYMVKELKSKEEAIRNEKIKQLRSMIDGQEIERQRLSRELHDGLGQLLFGIKMNIESLFDNNKSATKDKKEEILRNFDSTIEEVRRISNNLKPAVLEEFGIITALNNLCKEIENNCSFSFTYSIEDEGIKLGRRSQVYLFRIAQEALNNIVKHSKAKNVSLNLFKEEKNLILSVEDDGTGFISDQVVISKGNGLRNMVERVNLLKGITDINSVPGRGTIITIKIPYNCNI